MTLQEAKERAISTDEQNVILCRQLPGLWKSCTSDEQKMIASAIREIVTIERRHAVKEAIIQAITDIEQIVIKLSSESMYTDLVRTSLLMKELNNLKNKK